MGGYDRERFVKKSLLRKVNFCKARNPRFRRGRERLKDRGLADTHFHRVLLNDLKADLNSSGSDSQLNEHLVPGRIRAVRTIEADITKRPQN